MSIYDIEVNNSRNEKKSMSDYKDKVLLIVNVASHCGFTQQYKGLEALYKKYRGKGLEVLGFPCNQFGEQEPGDAKEIQSFCELNFGVTFPLFAKVDVNGNNADPLFQFLKSEKKGLLGTEGIKWNFTKFLVSKDGKVLDRYAPKTTPEELSGDIEAALS